MRSWYARMDTFVLPSHREGIPRTCMEAASMGLPVIATDIRGCREVVKNGETGILSVCTRSRRAGGSD
jgi:glycosyltransferase involved in cell wall biosynthesis